MTVSVSFVVPGNISQGWAGAGVARVRIMENLAVGATTVNVTQAGDVVLVCSSEGGMVAIAYGTAPDAAATTENIPTTSAGVAVPSGGASVALTVPAGSKINVKAIA